VDTRTDTNIVGRDSAGSEQRSESGRDADVVGRIIGRLCHEVGPDRYARYFDRQARLSVHRDRVDVTVGSSFLAELLDRRFGDSIRKAARAELPEGSLDLCFKVDHAAFVHAPMANASLDRGAAGAAEINARATREHAAAHRPQGQIETARQAVVGHAASHAPRRALSAGLGGHTLDDFIVGDSNRMAYAAALQLAAGADQANSTGGAVRAVFIHGMCGMGKTHLLQGVARRFAQARPGAIVRCASAEAFTNEYITAIRTGKVDAFRASYRKVDLLALDDVHFLSNKEATQGELLHTIDAAGLSGARLILASDEHPREIRKLSAALVSRFMAGGVARLESPDAALCRRLIAGMAAKRGLVIEPAAVDAMAEHAISRAGPGGVSVRDLAGLVTQVEAVHRLLPEFATSTSSGGVGLGGHGAGVIGLALVRKATGGGAPRVRRPVPLGVIAEEVCRHLQVQMTDLTGKGRHKRVVLARAMITFLARRLTTHSFPEIARAIGRPNHSTVITAHKRIVGQMKGDSRGEAKGGVRAESAALAELGEPFASLTLAALADRLEREAVRAAGA